MVLNSSEVEHGVTHWYVSTIKLREGESICLSSTYIYSEKCQNSSAISRTWARDRETTVCPAKVPCKHIAQDFVTETNRKQTRVRPAWFFTFQVICLLQLLEEVKSSETNVTCVFMKAAQQKMLFPCIQPDSCSRDATLHLKANVHRSHLVVQHIFPQRIPEPQSHCMQQGREGELLAEPNWHGNVVHGSPGAHEQIHRQQLGLSLGADANTYAVQLTEFLWQKMRNGERGPRLPLELWAELAGYHFRKRHPLFLSCPLQKTLHNREQRMV